MGRLLKVYFMNIFKSKGYYICLLINILLSIVLPYIANIVTKAPSTTVAKEIVGILGVGIVEVIYITIFVCSDFTDGAAKNFISRGYTRRQLLYVKFIASLIAVYVFFIVQAGLLFAIYHNSLGFDNSTIIYIVGALISTMAAVGFYVIVANTAEKLGLAIAINIVFFSLVPSLILLLMVILKTDINLSQYWVTTLISLVPSEGAKMMDLLKLSGITLLYLVILFELSNYIIKKKEVK